MRTRRGVTTRIYGRTGSVTGGCGGTMTRNMTHGSGTVTGRMTSCGSGSDSGTVS